MQKVPQPVHTYNWDHARLGKITVILSKFYTSWPKVYGHLMITLARPASTTSNVHDSLKMSLYAVALRFPFSGTKKNKHVSAWPLCLCLTRAQRRHGLPRLEWKIARAQHRALTPNLTFGMTLNAPRSSCPDISGWLEQANPHSHKYVHSWPSCPYVFYWGSHGH